MVFTFTREVLAIKTKLYSAVKLRYELRHTHTDTHIYDFVELRVLTSCSLFRLSIAPLRLIRMLLAYSLRFHSDLALFSYPFTLRIRLAHWIEFSMKFLTCIPNQPGSGITVKCSNRRGNCKCNCSFDAAFNVEMFEYFEWLIHFISIVMWRLHNITCIRVCVCITFECIRTLPFTCIHSHFTHTHIYK